MSKADDFNNMIDAAHEVERLHEQVAEAELELLELWQELVDPDATSVSLHPECWRSAAGVLGLRLNNGKGFGTLRASPRNQPPETETK